MLVLGKLKLCSSLVCGQTSTSGHQANVSKSVINEIWNHWTYIWDKRNIYTWFYLCMLYTGADLPKWPNKKYFNLPTLQNLKFS